MPYWDELRYNELDEVNGPEDVNLPPLMHHMQAKAELELLTRAGAISGQEAKEVMDHWKASQEMDSTVRLRAAVDELVTVGVIDTTEAERMKSEIAG